MGIGEGIGQGLMFLANQVASNKRAKKEEEQALQMFNMKRQAEIEDMQKQNEIKRQFQLEDQANEQQNNLNANQAIMGLTGQQPAEGYDPTLLKYVAPNQINSVLDDMRNAATKKEENERKRSAVRALYKNLPESAKKNMTEDDFSNLDPNLANNFLNQLSSREQRDFAREDNQAFRQSLLGQQFSNQKQLKQIAASLKSSKSGRGSGGSGSSGGSGFKQTRDGNFVKVDKKGNPTGQIISARDAYNMGITNVNPRANKPKTQNRPAPIFNFSPNVNR